MFTKQLNMLLVAGFVLVTLFLLFGVTHAGTEKKVSYKLAEVIPMAGIVQVSAGTDHACAVTNQGGVKCWGGNFAGRLGDGTTTDRLTAVDVVGLTTGVTAVAAGQNHTCALTSSGGVKCWGWFGYGALGDGTATTRLTPVDVVGLTSGVKAISVGIRNSCALLLSGEVKCWGGNDAGQLGDGTTTNRPTPVGVSGLTTNVSAISAAEIHTCALTVNGAVKCAGINMGQLGDLGGINFRMSFMDVPGLTTNVTAISTGKEHNCILGTSEGIRCLGRNASGQLGDGTTVNSTIPVDVVGLTTGVTAVSAGENHTCALTSSGGVKCWGGNIRGQLGDGTTTVRSSPVDVVGLTTGVTAVSSGASYTCAVTSSGGVKCWGKNVSGQLGDDTTSDRSIPVDVLVAVANTPTPNATSTPIFTPSPPNTPTAIPSITFTPTPEVNKPIVIFIPGIAGSQLVRNIPFQPDQYLWPVFSDGPKEKMSLKPGLRDNSIYTDDVIRNYTPLNIPGLTRDVYGTFIDNLITADYIEYKTAGDPIKRREGGCDTSQVDANLFVFPWDWRFGAVDAVTVDGDLDSDLSLAPNNAALLKEYVQCIRRIHPDAEITLISHSMGWFVGRTYVLQNPGSHNITRHIAIAPPRLGAPQAIAMMFTGDWIPELISKDLTRMLLEHFPGAHHLLPSELYWQMDSSPLSLNNPWGTTGDVTIDKYQEIMQAYYTSPAESDFYRSSIPFVDNMKKVYENPAFADLRSDISGVEYHIIYGVQDNALTTHKVVQKPLLSYDGTANLGKYDLIVTKGDGTVPEVSASAIGKNGLNLNGNATLHKLTGNAMEHQAMMSEQKLQNCVLALLGEDSMCDAVSAATSNQTSIARYIKLWGVEELLVTDEISTTQNLMTTTLTLGMFPDITAKYLGDGSIMLVITSDKEYILNFTGQGEYFESELQYSYGDSNLRFIRFSPEPSTGQLLTLVTASSALAEMQMDTDRDGTVDTAVQPIADLQEDVANDTTPPQVTANYDTVIGLVVIATDDKSGVADILYTVDGTHFQPYTEAVIFTQQDITNVSVIAQDKVGNISAPVSVPVKVIAFNSVYLPLITR